MRFDRSAQLVGSSEPISHLRKELERVARADAKVLITGESGTGKEVVARQLYALSSRAHRAFVPVNCAGLPETLLESELFGHVKGSFTGAFRDKPGKLEVADEGIIFLDEVGEMTLRMQGLLLRFLETGEIQKVGAERTGSRVNVRTITATNRNLREMVASGEFREDLFYRLNVFPVRVPPLRDRADDIPSLVWQFVDEFSRTFGKRIDSIPRKDMEALQHYAWPGNIRELRNVVERAMIIANGTRLNIQLPARSEAAGPAARRSLKMADVERDHVRSVLESTSWRIRGLGGAAELLGLQPTTLETRMIKLGLSRPRP